MTRSHRLATLTLVCAVVAAGCTSNGDPNTPNGASPPPTSTNGDSSDAPELDETTAIDLYVALQHAIIQLAPTDPERIDPDAAGDGIVVAGSPADQFLNERVTAIQASGVGPAGEVVHAEVSAFSTLSADRRSATLCALQQVEMVDVSTGQPAQGVPDAAEPRYTSIDVTYEHDGAWLIADLTADDVATLDDCVPPSIEETIHASWDDYIDALAAWINSSFAVQSRAALEPLVTTERWRQIEATEPAEPTGRHFGDIAYDLSLLHATANEVTGEWCIDGTRDPDATTVRNGELVPDDTRSVIRARWELEDGQWLLAAPDPSRGDGETLAGSVGAPEGHRCL